MVSALVMDFALTDTEDVQSRISATLLNSFQMDTQLQGHGGNAI